MTAIYRRLGHEQTGTLVRWARPVRIDDRLDAIPSAPARAVAARIGNALLSSHGWKGSKHSCNIQIHEGPTGEEFSRLDQCLAQGNGIRTEKPAGYAEWRFPSNANRILAARRDGKLLGYVVTQASDAGHRIVDLVSVEQPDVIARLLDSAVDDLAARDAKTVSLAAVASHPWNDIFHRAGFRPREEFPVMVIARPGGPVQAADFQNRWYAMDSERDS